MRILIANHIDRDLVAQADQRTFTQRMLWFARAGDVVVLPSEPDRRFVDHVTALTGECRDEIEICVAPPGRHGGKLLDPRALLDDEIVGRLAKVADRVTEVMCCWPSVEVALFAERLGIADKLPGAAFFAQGGVELANSKASFRAFAAACEVPIAEGAVCRTIDDAQVAIERLLANHRAIVVKQAHNHAGLGNELVTLDDRSSYDHAGAMHLRRVDGTGASVRAYLEERWRWASGGDRYAVTVEQFKPKGRTVYTEFFADGSGVAHTESGELIYRRRRLFAELAPVRSIDADVRARLVEAGARLAEVYRAFGYRGFLSADAVVDRDGEFIFTEMNARLGGSPHIYQAIGQRVVETARAPHRTVIQYYTQPHWKIPSLDHFLAAVDELGLSYDREARKGVIVAIPPLTGGGGFLFCIAYDAEHEHVQIFEALDARFGETSDAH